MRSQLQECPALEALCNKSNELDAAGKEARDKAAALAASHTAMSTMEETAADAQQVTGADCTGHDVVSDGSRAAHSISKLVSSSSSPKPQTKHCFVHSGGVLKSKEATKTRPAVVTMQMIHGPEHRTDYDRLVDSVAPTPMTVAAVRKGPASPPCAGAVSSLAGVSGERPDREENPNFGEPD